MLGAGNQGARRGSLIILVPGGVVALLAAVLLMAASAANAAPPSVGLGTAGSFAVLAGSTVTNTGPSVINGDLGVSPGTDVTGFPPGIVNGTIHAADADAGQAQSDLTIAYNDAAGRTPAVTVATELGGQTLTSGVYDSETGTFELTGTVTLDAEGDTTAVFIFQAASTLVTASDSAVSLVNGAQACNVFWQVGSSATLGTSSTFRGNILALTSITLNTGTTVDGRTLARNGAVTLDDNVITRSACTTPPPPTTPPTSPPPTTPPPTTPSPTSPPPMSPPPTTPPGDGDDQVGRVPSGGVDTGGGSTAGVQKSGLLAVGVGLLAAAGATLAVRRRAVKRDGAG